MDLVSPFTPAAWRRAGAGPGPTVSRMPFGHQVRAIASRVACRFEWSPQHNPTDGVM
jgi:hypothetical protein